MRLSRLTTLLACVLLALVAAPASALAASQSLAITSPTGFPAGGDPTYSSAITFDSSAGTPSTITVSLAPGVLASPAANASCVKTTQDSGTACEIGTGSVATSLVSVPVTAYLAPPPTSSDVVGIDVVPGLPGLPTTHGGAQLVQAKSGNVQTVLQLSLSGLGPLAGLVSGVSLTINGTLDGKPFNRMPTNCSPGQSTVTVVYSSKTETTAASPDFAPTGCSALSFSPRIHGTAHATPAAGDPVTTTITEPAGQAAAAKTTIAMPLSALQPNLASVKYQNTSHPVGYVVAVSPLLPTALHGRVFLQGSLTNPLVVFEFPPPAAMSLIGKVNLSSNSFTIPVVPDVPLSRLKVSFPGGPYGLLAVSCPKTAARLNGTFVGQNGKTFTSVHRVIIKGC